MKKLLRSEFDPDDFEETRCIYSQDKRIEMLENDEISGWEAAFMEGWDNAVV